jgi:hypothetical protein
MPSFKVPCPSCEAQVLIKNPNLIGTKVECPKCKYRFKVEEPAADAPAGDEKKPKEEKKAKAKKPKGKSKMPAVLIAVGVLVLVGGVGYAVLGPKKKTTTTGTGPRPIQPGQVEPGEDDQNKDEKPKEKPKPKYLLPVSAKDPTNLLPNQSIAVYRFNMEQVQFSPPFNGVFDANAGLFEQSMGFKAENVAAYYHCVVGADRGSFGVMRLTAPVAAKDLAAKMSLEPNPKTVNKNYVLHTIKSNPFATAVGQTFAARSLLGDVYETMPGKPVGPPKPSGVCFYDNNTILMGDLPVVDAFLAGLKADGYPEFKSVIAAADGKVEGKGVLTDSTHYRTIDVALRMNLQAVDADPQNPPMIVYAELLAPGEYDAKKFRKEYKPIGDVLDPLLVRAKSVGANLTEFTTKKMTATVRIVTGTDSEARELVVQHLTPGLTAAIPPLSLFFGTLIELRDGATPPPSGSFPPTGSMPPTGSVPPRGSSGGETGSADGGTPSSGGSMGTPPRGQISLGGQGGSASGPPTSGSMTSAGAMSPRGGITPPPGMMPGTSSSGPPTSAGAGAQPPTGTVPPTATNQSFVELKRVDNVVTFTVEIYWNEDVYRRTLQPRLMSLSNQAKGKMAVYAASYGLHPLAEAVKAYTAQYKAFPRGTSATPVHVGIGLQYPPLKRVSFYRDLLPFMERSKTLLPALDSKMGWAEEKLTAGSINKETGERSEDAQVLSNVEASGNWVPELLVPYYPPTAWRATSPLAPDKVFGGTNFVAIAGIGAEAARMDPSDKDAAKKVGITGYSWGSKLDEVTDGLDKTIYLMQVPPGLSRPWAQGGGATLMGVDEKDPMAAFAYPRPDGERGAHAIMGDGTIRWIPEKIDPKVFLAMATRAGGETLPANLDALCPKVEVKKVEEPKLIAEVPPVGKTPPVAPVPAGPDNVAPPPREKSRD